MVETFALVLMLWVLWAEVRCLIARHDTKHLQELLAARNYPEFANTKKKLAEVRRLESVQPLTHEKRDGYMELIQGDD